MSKQDSKKRMEALARRVAAIQQVAHNIWSVGDLADEFVVTDIDADAIRIEEAISMLEHTRWQLNTHGLTHVDLYECEAMIVHRIEAMEWRLANAVASEVTHTLMSPTIPTNPTESRVGARAMRQVRGDVNQDFGPGRTCTRCDGPRSNRNSEICWDCQAVLDRNKITGAKAKRREAIKRNQVPSEARVYERVDISK